MCVRTHLRRASDGTAEIGPFGRPGPKSRNLLPRNDVKLDLTSAVEEGRGWAPVGNERYRRCAPLTHSFEWACRTTVVLVAGEDVNRCVRIVLNPMGGTEQDLAPGGGVGVRTGRVVPTCDPCTLWRYTGAKKPNPS